jgi:hypothetical protein
MKETLAQRLAPDVQDAWKYDSQLSSLVQENAAVVRNESNGQKMALALSDGALLTTHIDAVDDGTIVCECLPLNPAMASLKVAERVERAPQVLVRKRTWTISVRDTSIEFVTEEILRHRIANSTSFVNAADPLSGPETLARTLASRSGWREPEEDRGRGNIEPTDGMMFNG